MKYLSILFLILSTNIFPQVSIGFTIEGTGLITDVTSRITPLSAAGILLGIKPSQNFNIELRTGFEPGIIEDYKGWNFSGYINYFIKDPLYLISGVSIHSNDPHDSNSGGSTHESAILIGAGAGVNLNNHLSLELLYHLPLKQEKWVYHYDFLTQTFSSEKLTGVIKANLKFSWDL